MICHDTLKSHKMVFIVWIYLNSIKTKFESWDLVSYLLACCWFPLSLSLRCHTPGPLAECMMNTAHLTGNTSGVSKSSSDWSNYRNLIELSEMCVSHSFCQTSSWKKKDVIFTIETMSAYQDQLNAGFSKYVKNVHFTAYNLSNVS